MKGSEFAEAVLACPGMTDLRDTCMGWIAPAKVARCRGMFALPPTEDLSGVGSHLGCYKR